ncbi:MAG TPA: BamA/TamA family outer membrane protein [Thermoanaerobaculia bacterium]|nr:BamA/TamA family outer membrane protein [Thermoanaerobaculia bacterium]
MKRSITLWTLFATLMLSASPAYPFGKNKIVYDRFEWKIYHSTHFDVYFYETERDSLQKVVNFAESAYDELSRKFNFQISKRIPLIYYATHSAFEQTNVILNFIPEGVGAFATPVRNRMVLPIDMPDEDLLSLIKHELTHIFQYEILFQGRFGQELRIAPPTWLMEGMASFMAEDESSRDRMVLRDAVVNDNIPPIDRNVQGFFAYRFGHAVFQYMLTRYGWDGVRDFIYEYRNTLGSSIAKPLKRAFDLTPEEFNTQFRTWLRRQYLPVLVTKGEPTEYGRPFTVKEDVRSQEMMPAPAPSGDLMVALTTYKEDVDVVLFNIPKREMFRNLTRGLPERYEYIISQWLTTGPVMGRDVAFAPNGDQVAVFVKRERGRNLMLLNALTGRIEKLIPMEGVEQQLNPAYSPDGTKIAFHAFRGNQADIFIYDLSSGEITNITDDAFYDAAPVYSPDGRSLVYSSVVDGYAKLFRLDVGNPSARYQLTTGPSNDSDAYFSPDGTRVFFTSDRQTSRWTAEAAKLFEMAEGRIGGEERSEPPDPANFAAYNIYSLDLRSGDVLQYTDVVGGCFTPVVFIGAENKEQLVFSSYYKGRWRLYTTTTDKQLFEAETTVLPSEPMLAGERTPFLPPVEVAIDPEKIEKYRSLRLFVDDVQVNAGVTSDQTFVSRSVIFTSDMLGDRRFIAALDSVSTFSNFDLLYLDLRRRLNWGVRLFDDRTFFIEQDQQSGQLDQRLLYHQTAALGILSYPFDRYHRIDLGAGYMVREFNFPFLDEAGELAFIGRKDDFPLASATFSGDSARFKEFGPIDGRRYQLTSTYAPDLDGGGTLTSDFVLDFRQYMQLTSRSLLAARIFAGYSDGNFPNFYYFGGLNTLRGFDFRTFAGSRAFYGNFEIRFPLVDVIATPIIVFSQIRGSLFFDVGGAFFDGQNFTFMRDGRLHDAKGSVGYGVSLNLFGLELHWDFAKRTDLKDIESGTRTSFWIGQTF